MAKRFPFSGIPTGWYMVGHSRELKRGKVLTRHFFDQDVVLYRTESGEFRATKAYCPHLGAHMGQGRVCGEELECKFHGFKFDLDGQCVSTPYKAGRPPRKAKLPHFEVREVNGLLLVHYDALGRAPEWDAPVLDMDEYTEFRWYTFELDSHPQETSENSVDIGHFGELHGFLNPETYGLQVEGPLLRAQYGFERRLDFLGMKDKGLPAKFDVSVYGLGYSLVQVRVPIAKLEANLLIMSTPINEGRIKLHTGVSMKRHKVPFATRPLQAAIMGGLVFEVGTDVPIWEAKKYEARPLLAEGDGPIAAYRRWAKQFYPPTGVEDAGSGKHKLPLAN